VGGSHFDRLEDQTEKFWTKFIIEPVMLAMQRSFDKYLDEKCPICDSDSQVYINPRAGDVVCGDCGQVLRSRILDSSEEIIYADDRDTKMSRTSGMEETLGSQETLFLFGGTAAQREQLERAQRMTSSKKEKNILKYIPRIKEFCQSMELCPAVKVSI
jgi:transcription initiation factor TFIIIB Brf1 subunit/transcription initiation factor TFIIB